MCFGGFCSSADLNRSTDHGIMTASLQKHKAGKENVIFPNPCRSSHEGRAIQIFLKESQLRTYCFSVPDNIILVAKILLPIYKVSFWSCERDLGETFVEALFLECWNRDTS